ncbi:hypothetical protein E0Z10_g8068 [Xylaria hypoxylon]|uniref:Uncharacterized protein n=1 Tax=Xylaria hypoxylon TaxID=37992 RepID=A0A4Z0YKP8_9PEZI|nr:hypothetical protein E0Z10_g8068 [Xylaria hypoxylon]
MPQTWLVTGCSSGFGELFVRQLRDLGDNVIATGRNSETRLAHLKDTGAVVMDLDVSTPASEIEAKIAEAWDLYPDGIDVVVNNAGYILSGAVEELTSLLPKLRAKGKGILLYISSQAGWHADPGAVECLSQELAMFAPGIKVLIVEPGYFRTSAFSNINHVPPRVPDYAGFNAAVRSVEASIVGNEPGDAEKGVAIIIDLVKGTGVAAGKNIPLRVPLGSDGWVSVGYDDCQKCNKVSAANGHEIPGHVFETFCEYRIQKKKKKKKKKRDGVGDREREVET